MDKKPMDWDEAVSLENRVIFLFKTNQADSDEFRTYLRIFGKEKMRAIWKKFLNIQTEREPGDDDES